jgi:superfamily II DNA/RNA helicase
MKREAYAPAAASACEAQASWPDSIDPLATWPVHHAGSAQSAAPRYHERRFSVTPRTTGFAALGVPADLVDALASDGFETPFPIQRECVPPALAGRDLCGRAATGSGKTLAYGIPMLARVDQAEPNQPTGVILVPTRELARQVRTDLLGMGKARRRYVLAVYGGTPYVAQRSSFQRGASIVVACPGRLLDFVRRGQVDLGAVQVCVVDEADRLADLGFMDDVRALLDEMPADRQTLLFSATLDGDVDELVTRYQRDPVRIDLTSDDPDVPADHHVMVVRSIERVGAAANLVRQHGRTIVFTRTREGTDSLATALAASGVRTASMHGGMSQSQRERSLHALRRGHVDALVATDVAARGIHVDDVELVLHWDVAMDAKDYVHRSGRTARAGAGGTVITLVTDTHARRANRITKQAGVDAGSLAAPARDGRDARSDSPGRRDGVRREQGSRPGRTGGVKTVSHFARRSHAGRSRPSSRRSRPNG